MRVDAKNPAAGDDRVSSVSDRLGSDRSQNSPGADAAQCFERLLDSPMMLPPKCFLNDALSGGVSREMVFLS